MKDLIAKLKSDATCAIGALYMHIDAQAARIAELEAQIAVASAPVVEQQPDWMDFNIEKTGDDHFDAGNFLLNAAKEFWSACHKAKQYGAVQWLLGENGELLIFTRGEYKNVLLNNIEMSGQTKHFKEPQAANKLREALLSVIPEKMVEKHGREFFQGEGQDEHRAEIKGWNDCRDYVCKHADKAFQVSTALQAPVREVPEGWVSTKDRLPPELNKAYLIWCPNNKCIYTAYMDDEEFCWYYFADNAGAVGERITHWCEIPAAPVQEPKP